MDFWSWNMANVGIQISNYQPNSEQRPKYFNEKLIPLAFKGLFVHLEDLRVGLEM